MQKPGVPGHVPTVGRVTPTSGSNKHGTSVKHVTATKHRKGLTAKQQAAIKKWQQAGTKASAAAAKAKHTTHAKGLALAYGAACCSAEALAATLRLTGATVTDADVLTLYLATASDLDAGASILDTLEAAAEFGLAGYRPRFRATRSDAVSRSGLVIGTELPGGPHALTIDPRGGIWSWGALYALDDLRPGPAEEAWVIAWQ